MSLLRLLLLVPLGVMGRRRPIPDSVPRAPEINPSGCVVCDNTVTVSWRPACEGTNAEEIPSNGAAERYELEYRKSSRKSSGPGAGGACWEKVQDIRDTRVTVSGEGTSSSRGHAAVN